MSIDVMGRPFKPLFPGDLEEWEGKMWPNEEGDNYEDHRDGCFDSAPSYQDGS